MAHKSDLVHVPSDAATPAAPPLLTSLQPCTCCSNSGAAAIEARLASIEAALQRLAAAFKSSTTSPPLGRAPCKVQQSGNRRRRGQVRHAAPANASAAAPAYHPARSPPPLMSLPLPMLPPPQHPVCPAVPSPQRRRQTALAALPGYTRPLASRCLPRRPPPLLTPTLTRRPIAGPSVGARPPLPPARGPALPNPDRTPARPAVTRPQRPRQTALTTWPGHARPPSSRCLPTRPACRRNPSPANWRIPDQSVAPVPGDSLSLLPVLRQAMPSPPPPPLPPRPAHVPADQRTATSLFLRTDAPTGPLQLPYTGPYRVLHRWDDYVTLDVKGHRCTVSWDRVTAAELPPAPPPQANP